MPTDNEAMIEAIFDEAKSLNASRSIVDNKVRVRMTYDPVTGNPTIDLSKANKDCQGCRGKGISDIRKVSTGPQIDYVPVVCICVKENGGVTPDSLDNAILTKGLS